MCWFRQSCPSTSTAAHSHTGLFVDRSHTSSSLGFIKAVKAAGCHKKKSRAPNRFGALLHATLMRQVLRTGKQAQTAEASCTCTCTSSSCCCGSSSCTPFLRFRSAPGWLQCLQYTPLLRECQHFRCTFMHEKCKFDKLHKPTGLAGYRLAKNLQK